MTRPVSSPGWIPAAGLDRLAAVRPMAHSRAGFASGAAGRISRAAPDRNEKVMAALAPHAHDDAFLSDARKRMVDSQLRPNKVGDPLILGAMRRLPRERFLPPA